MGFKIKLIDDNDDRRHQYRKNSLDTSVEAAHKVKDLPVVRANILSILEGEMSYQQLWRKYNASGFEWKSLNCIQTQTKYLRDAGYVEQGDNKAFTETGGTCNTWRKREKVSA